jgi:type I restriction enzyme S subunit
MSSEWTELKLGEIVTFKTGKLDSNAAEEMGQFPFFTCSPNTLTINSFAFDTEAVILAGNNANGVFSIKHYSGKFNAYQRTYVIEPINKETVSSRYAYFLLSQMIGSLKELSIGSATKFLTKTILNALPVRLPPKSEQDEIALVLSTLDDRITLLRETNTTLEAIAQALFKSWFVDFDPVHAKMQGRAPEGMDEVTAAQFPDSFEESELGPVPKGWKPIRLDSFIELAYGKALKSDMRRPGAVPVYGSGGITGWHDTPLVKEASVVVGRKGTVGSIYWESRPFFPIDTVFYVKASKPLTYCHQLLMTLGLNDMNTDAAVPGLNRENVYRLKVPDVPSVATAAFDDIVSALRRSIYRNNDQAQTLSDARDALLPRLISGQQQLKGSYA